MPNGGLSKVFYFILDQIIVWFWLYFDNCKSSLCKKYDIVTCQVATDVEMRVVAGSSGAGPAPLGAVATPAVHTTSAAKVSLKIYLSKKKLPLKGTVLQNFK